MMEPRVLIVSSLLPGRLRSGGAIVTHSFLEGLRAVGCEAGIIGYSSAKDPSVTEGQIEVARRTVETRDAPFSALVWGAGAVLAGRAYTVQKNIGPTYRRKLRQVLASTPWNLVVVEHAQMSWILDELPQVPLVHLSHNVESELYHRLSQTRAGPARHIFRRESRLVGRSERALCRACDEIWALTPDDARHFEKLGARRARAFGVPVPTAPPRLAASRHADVAILGSWTWEANRAGLDWYLAEVHPRLPSHVSVHIGGAGASDLKGRHDNLTYHGIVEDAALFLAQARCVAVPSVQGAGIQIKTLDAIATGNRIVATPLAMRGIDDPPDTVVVAATGSDFAQALCSAAAAPLPDRQGSGVEWSQRRRRQFEEGLREAVSSVLAGR